MSFFDPLTDKKVLGRNLIYFFFLWNVEANSLTIQTYFDIFLFEIDYIEKNFSSKKF